MTQGKRVALIGAKGMLAQMVANMAPADWELSPFDLPEFDLTDRAQVLAAMTLLQPQYIINCAAFTNVDGCEDQEALATRVNGDGPGNLAAAALAVGAVLVHISTDYVFDGSKTTPYTEEDSVCPLSAYGRSKLRGEEAIAASGLTRYFIVRTSWLYGPGGKNFVETMLRLAAERTELKVVADQFGSPTYTGDLAAAIFALLETDQFGIYHFSNSGACSWHGFAEAIVELARQAGATLTAQAVLPIATADYPLPAPRPAYSVFAKDKIHRVTGLVIPQWRAALLSYLKSRTV